MSKALRQKKILELISEREIETQEELASRLKELGFEVTQATVSRDIRELSLVKLPPGQGKQKYIVSDVAAFSGELSDKYVRVLKEAIVSVDNAQNLLVIKTVSGMAMAVAAAVDSMHLKEIVGSIAGDDTIMAAVRTTEDATMLKEQFLAMYLS